MNKYLLGAVVVLGLIGVAIYFSYTSPSVTDYESCAEAEGSVIMESYPEQCRTADGETFTRELDEKEEERLNPPTSDRNTSEREDEELEEGGEESEGGETGLTNPASVHCEEQGGTLEIREGGSVGYCIFDDGSECEEWAFFRGECPPE